MEVSMRRLFESLVLSLVLVSPAVAQTPTAAPPSPQGTMSGPRGGFTILTTIGAGFQRDEGLEESAAGLAGLNLGIGGFLDDRAAVMFRISGTNAKYDFDEFGEVRQVSGVAGGSLQYWLNERFAVEGGAGVGFWRAAEEDEQGFGLILGASGVIFMHGKHNITAGIEYAPAFTDSGTVHNFGFVVGYQFVRR
jgi:hypothetical protein